MNEWKLWKGIMGGGSVMGGYELNENRVVVSNADELSDLLSRYPCGGPWHRRMAQDGEVYWCFEGGVSSMFFRKS
jgi:hypothetical protein